MSDNVASPAHGSMRMSTFRRAIVRLAAIAALSATAGGLKPALAQTPGPAQAKIPELASSQFAWLVLGVDWLDPPPGLGRGPIRWDPAYPQRGNRDGGQVT